MPQFSLAALWACSSSGALRWNPGPQAPSVMLLDPVSLLLYCIEEGNAHPSMLCRCSLLLLLLSCSGGKQQCFVPPANAISVSCTFMVSVMLTVPVVNGMGRECPITSFCSALLGRGRAGLLVGLFPGAV